MTLMPNIRAIVYHINFYDVQSKIFNTVTIMIENFAGSQLEGTKQEIMTYEIPLQDSTSVSLYVLRVLVTIWYTATLVATLLRRSSFNALFSEETFFDVFLSMALVIMQWINIGQIGRMSNEFVSGIEDIYKPEIRNNFFLLRGFGYQYMNI